jgi:hypothetical protein
MKPKLAQYIICTLVSNSHFLKGLLYGKNAWGEHGFPEPAKEPEEYQNLVQLLRVMADGLEKLKEDK